MLASLKSCGWALPAVFALTAFIGYALVLARASRLRTSLNLAIDSALASFSQSGSAVANVASDSGRATALQGTVHQVICTVYLFTTIVP